MSSRPSRHRDGEETRPAHRWIAILALVGLAVIASLLLHGYRFGESDHFEQLPQIRRQLDVDYLSRDWFVNATAHSGSPRYGYSLLMATAAKLLGEPAAFWLMYIVSLAVSAASVGLWALRRFRTWTAFFAAAFLALTLTGGTLGDSRTGIPFLVPALLAWSLIAAGAALLDHKRWALAGLVFGVCTLIHPLLGPEGFALGLVWTLGRMRSPAPAARAAMAYLPLGLIGLAPLLGAQWTDVSAAEQISILAHQRHPWHYVPSTWPLSQWLAFVGLFAAVALRIRLDRRIKDLQWITALMLAVSVLGFFFTEIWPVAIVVKAQVFRLTAMLPLVAAIVFGGWIGQRSHRGFQHRVALTVLIISLAGALIEPLLFLGLAAVVAVAVVTSSLPSGTPPSQAIIAAGVAVIAIGSVLAMAITDRIDLRLLTAMAIAIGGLHVAGWFQSASRAQPHWLTSSAVLMIVTVSLAAIYHSAMTGGYPRILRPWLAPVQGTVAYVGPLDEIAAWARSTTPHDSLFLVPPHYSGFRVKADRAIIVDFKAFAFQPSDMVEWKERLMAVTSRSELVLGDGYQQELAAAYAAQSIDQVAMTARHFGAEYVIVAANMSGDFGQPVYEADGWAVIESGLHGSGDQR